MTNDAAMEILRGTENGCSWHGGCTDECLKERIAELKVLMFAEAAGILDSIAGDSEGSPLQSAFTIAAKLIRTASKTGG